MRVLGEVSLIAVTVCISATSEWENTRRWSEIQSGPGRAGQVVAFGVRLALSAPGLGGFVRRDRLRRVVGFVWRDRPRRAVGFVWRDRVAHPSLGSFGAIGLLTRRWVRLARSRFLAHRWVCLARRSCGDFRHCGRIVKEPDQKMIGFWIRLVPRIRAISFGPTPRSDPTIRTSNRAGGLGRIASTSRSPSSRRPRRSGRRGG
jgi:hypothetical protein